MMFNPEKYGLDRQKFNALGNQEKIMVLMYYHKKPMSVKAIAAKLDLPLDYVKSLLEQSA